MFITIAASNCCRKRTCVCVWDARVEIETEIASEFYATILRSRRASAQVKCKCLALLFGTSNMFNILAWKSMMSSRVSKATQRVHQLNCLKSVGVFVFQLYAPNSTCCV